VLATVQAVEPFTPIPLIPDSRDDRQIDVVMAYNAEGFAIEPRCRPYLPQQRSPLSGGDVGAGGLPYDEAAVPAYLNLAGSAVLAVIAFVDERWGFLLLKAPGRLSRR
jgi:hypothetical protein